MGRPREDAAFGNESAGVSAISGVPPVWEFWACPRGNVGVARLEGVPFCCCAEGDGWPGGGYGEESCD